LQTSPVCLQAASTLSPINKYVKAKLELESEVADSDNNAAVAMCAKFHQIRYEMTELRLFMNRANNEFIKHTCSQMAK